MIGRDHLDAGSVASPNRETEAMLDGSDAIADWPILNALINTAAGAHWVSVHHGGGVGIGYSIHAGMVVVADGRRTPANVSRGCSRPTPAWASCATSTPATNARSRSLTTEACAPRWRKKSETGVQTFETIERVGLRNAERGTSTISGPQRLYPERVERHIVAMGGGQWPEDPVYRFIFELTGAARPKILSLPTATGDSDRNIAGVLPSFSAHSWDPRCSRCSSRRSQDLRSLVLTQDVVLVGGGNTLNMLAVWRAHGLDEILKEAWDAGVVLAGGSAGANCWFEASTTDSYLVGRSDPLVDGLGLAHGKLLPALRFRAVAAARRTTGSWARARSRPGSRATTSRRCISSAPMWPRSWRPIRAPARRERSSPVSTETSSRRHSMLACWKPAT